MSKPEDSQTILVVDDDRDYLEQQELILTAAGFSVLTAETVARAEELLDQQPVDLAILDLMMEDYDAGFSLAYRIKKQHPALPVIIVTGVAHETGLEFDAATSEERSWIKADCLLAKPVRREQLVAEINKLLGASHG
ncbi:response regulator [bacterium]|nr:response regulator [bacterium]